MNRSIRIILSFVLPFFCLLASVSNSATIEANTPYSSDSSAFTISTAVNPSELFGYTAQNIAGSVEAYIVDSDETTLKPILKDLASKGYSKTIIYIKLNGSLPTYCIDIFPDEFEFDFTFYEKITTTNGYEYIGLYAPANSYYYKFTEDRNTYTPIKITQTSTTDIYDYSRISIPDETNLNWGSYHFLEFNGMSVKQTTRSSGLATWDGTSYFYKVESEEPDTSTLPSNAEIAQAVQAFYDSDYYKNNKDFKDFLVMYNYNNQYFSFVGHNFGIDLGQVIVPPDYEYEGYSYKQDWWKFFLRNVSSEIASNLWNKYFWLYSTNDFGSTISSNGKGLIKDLVNLHFSTNSIIVYSTTDYPVVKIETDENGILTPVEGTVPGNQYTYDETLNPTENEYNPLKDFVPTDPSQSILGNVDFNEINKVFAENKNILNIENASWLFTANNKLVGYFIGFLSFLIVLIIISRLLGG